jgi:hypothetical protein
VTETDIFLNIKNVSQKGSTSRSAADDGDYANNIWEFGDEEKAARVFVRNKLISFRKG